MATEVTDPSLLEQLNSGGGSEVTDPKLLAQLNGNQPYSLGPISDVAELGARGINAIATMFGAQPRAPQPMFQPVNLPFIGQPSVAGYARGMYDTAKSGATLPGDVYAGRVDPLSEEGMRRAYDLAAITPLGTMPSLAQRAPTAALSAKAIDSAADTSYEAIRQRTRGDMLNPEYSKTVSDHMAAVVENAGAARQRLAPETHQLIKDARGAKDMADLVDIREQLGALVRGGGREGFAAAEARNALEEALGPQIAGIARTADRNKAIAKNATKAEQDLADAQQKTGTFDFGANEGTKIKQTFRPRLEKGRGQKLEEMSPATYEAVNRVVNPGWGVNALGRLGMFDPTSRFGMAMNLINAASAPYGFGAYHVALPAASMAAKAAYNRILRNRAAAVSEAIRSGAPATLVQPGYQGGGILGMPGAAGANAGILAPMQSQAPLRLTVRPSDAL